MLPDGSTPPLSLGGGVEPLAEGSALPLPLSLGGGVEPLAESLADGWLADSLAEALALADGSEDSDVEDSLRLALGEALAERLEGLSDRLLSD